MNAFIGVAMMIGGVVFGLYVGIWWAFVGGIAQVIDAFQVRPIDGAGVGLGILRVLFSAAIGYVCGFLLVLAGAVVVNQDR